MLCCVVPHHQRTSRLWPQGARANIRLLKSTHLDEIDVCQIGVVNGPLHVKLHASVAHVASGHGEEVAQSCERMFKRSVCRERGVGCPCLSI